MHALSCLFGGAHKGGKVQRAAWQFPGWAD